MPNSVVTLSKVLKFEENPICCMEMAKNCTQYIYINHVKKSTVDGYRDACENPDNCYSCNN